MLNTWIWLSWKKRDEEENRDKDEDGEEGEEMDRGEEGGLNHPPLCHNQSPACAARQERSRVDTLAVLCWNGLTILNILM